MEGICCEEASDLNLKDGILPEDENVVAFKKKSYWSIVNLQCCVSFRCTAE